MNSPSSHWANISNQGSKVPSIQPTTGALSLAGSVSGAVSSIAWTASSESPYQNTPYKVTHTEIDIIPFPTGMDTGASESAVPAAITIIWTDAEILTPSSPIHYIGKPTHPDIKMDPEQFSFSEPQAWHVVVEGVIFWYYNQAARELELKHRTASIISADAVRQRIIEGESSFDQNAYSLWIHAVGYMLVHEEGISPRHFNAGNTASFWVEGNQFASVDYGDMEVYVDPADHRYALPIMVERTK